MLGCHGSWFPTTVRVSHTVFYVIYVIWAHMDGGTFVWAYREDFVTSQMRHSLDCHTSFYVKQCGERGCTECAQGGFVVCSACSNEMGPRRPSVLVCFWGETLLRICVRVRVGVGS